MACNAMHQALCATEYTHDLVLPNRWVASPGIMSDEADKNWLDGCDSAMLFMSAHMEALTCRGTVHPETSAMHFRHSRRPLSVKACLYWKRLARLHVPKSVL